MNTINIHSTSSYIAAHCSLVTARVAAAKLLHKASTVTFNPHSARKISTGRRIIKTRRKRKGIHSSAHCYARWKLKHTPPVIYHITTVFRFLHYFTSNTTSLWIGRFNCPELVFTVTTLTYPSESGNVSPIIPSLQDMGGKLCNRPDRKREGFMTGTRSFI